MVAAPPLCGAGWYLAEDWHSAFHASMIVPRGEHFRLKLLRNLHTSATILILLIAHCAHGAPPTPIVSLDLKRAFPFAVEATVAFLSDETIAVVAHPGANGAAFNV